MEHWWGGRIRDNCRDYRAGEAPCGGGLKFLVSR